MNAVTKHPLWTVCVLLPLAALALWGSSRIGWAEADNSGGHPALLPLALLALTSGAANLAASQAMRRVMGAFWVLGGLFVCAVPFIDGGPLLWGRALAVTSGALIVAAGILSLFLAQRMPRFGAKYQTPRSGKESAGGEPDLWKALSEGDDPTAR
jgi:hypothetical protein